MTTYSLERVIRKFFPITNKQEVRNNTIQAAQQFAQNIGVQIDDLIGKSFVGYGRSSGALGCFYPTKTIPNQ